MINLRYHVVSLTAVFLALGIGLAFGSTFLDKATVDTLNAQINSLEGSLGSRDTTIAELESELDRSTARRDALDAEGASLLTGRAAGMPVIVLAARGADEADITAALQALVVAGADVQGTWWMTERFKLDDQGELNDLATLLGSTSTDPAQLRRAVIDDLALELGAGLNAELPVETPDVPAENPETPADGDPDGAPDGDPGAEPSGDPTAEEPTGDDAAAEDGDELGDEPADVAPAETTDVVAALFDNGFLEFQAVPRGPDAPVVPDGVRLVILGGSGEVADDLVLVPLVDRFSANSAGNQVIPAVVSSARSGDGEVSTAVTVVRQDDELREVISTVDTVEDFSGRAAMVLALVDAGDARVGHYGVEEGSTQLLPPLRVP